MIKSLSVPQWTLGRVWIRRGREANEVMDLGRLQAQSTKEIPHGFICPISMEIMVDPVTLSTGHSYDRVNIQRWLDEGHDTCPMTMQRVPEKSFIPNRTLRRLIETFIVKHWVEGGANAGLASGDALPLSLQIKLVLKDIMEDRGRDASSFFHTLRSMTKECEVNKVAAVDAGAPSVLISILLSEAIRCSEEFVSALGALAVLPLDDNQKTQIFQSEALPVICTLLKSSTIRERLYATEMLGILAETCELPLGLSGMPFSGMSLGLSAGRNIKETVRTENTGKDASGCSPASANPRRIIAPVTTVGVCSILHGLLNVINEVSPPKMVAAALKALVPMCLPFKNRALAVNAGAVSTLIDYVPVARRDLADQILSILEALCQTAEGREAARTYSLGIPTLVKCITRGSEAGTDYAVGALLAVCRGAPPDVSVTAIETGAITRLLLVLQSDCFPRSKHKVIELLKLLHEVWAVAYQFKSKYDASAIIV